jgi:hypothetical protein
MTEYSHARIQAFAGGDVHHGGQAFALGAPELSLQQPGVEGEFVPAGWLERQVLSGDGRALRDDSG